MIVTKIKKIDLREIWKHEALDFTKWLKDNLEILADTIQIELNNPESEQAAGDFFVDLIAEDNNGNMVVIENQLEKSDHAHLGKLLTYLTAYDAKTAIWIVAEPRQEHINTLVWLNESTSANFYLIKLEAIKIDDSNPAPLFTLIVEPTPEAKEIGIAKKDIAEREILRKKFWTGVLEKSQTKTNLHSNISPTHHHWIGTGAGKAGLAYNYVIRKDEAQIELYIDKGKDSEEMNLKIFNYLNENKIIIEEQFGDSLIWESLFGKRACRISKVLKIGGYRTNENEWDYIFEEMVNTMVKFEKAMKPYVEKI